MTPNILFIILDDVGKDQLASFNPAALTSSLTPNLNALAAAGLRFTGFETMPECSPSRATFFTGRYPLRTGVTAAILDLDLPAAHVSPYEVTTPRVLATAGYSSGLFGKFHLGGPENNPAGDNAPVAVGWNYFDGNVRGGPPSIDVTLGGQYTADKTRYSCGFPTGTQRGAVWFLGADNQARCDDNQGTGFTGQQGVTLGGIPALDARGNFAPTCRDAAETAPDFTKGNGYYVWPQVVADGTSLRTVKSRQYMTTAQTDAAIGWIKDQQARPWMATVSFNAIHTPFQQPPAAHYPPGFVWPSTLAETCTGTASERIIVDLMLASIDKEIGRLLVSIGVAEFDAGGNLVYRPDATDTMIVIVGDNGSLVSTVRAPYDPLRAKATAYVTGVTAPMIVAGPLVVGPGRSIDHQVNSVDLFQLFGEIAGVNVRTVVPPSHVLDSEPVLDYLAYPNQPSIRRVNFTQLGTGLKAPYSKVWTCVVPVGPVSIGVDTLFPSQSICEDDGGTWYGPTAAQPTPKYANSCEVRAAGIYNSLMILPAKVWAVRNSQYKLVKLERASCDSSLGEFEFYDLSPRPPANPIGLDLATANLLTNGQPVGLTADQQKNYQALGIELQALLMSERVCYGDGNLDKRVDERDLEGVRKYTGQPSVFDFNQDGTTDEKDAQCVVSNYRNRCRVNGPGNACK